MAALSNIKIEMELRPCIVRSIARKDSCSPRKALFHKWAEKEQVILKANAFLGSKEIERILDEYKKSGYISYGMETEKVKATVAIVEYEDGTVGEVLPENIRFLDSPHDQYGFTEREDTKK